ncbi:MAG: M48 family metallopeptidase [Candidatus Nanopelagicales bacterium]
MASFRAQQSVNRRKTWLLLGSMFSLVAFVVYAVALYFGEVGTSIVPIAVIIALISVWGSYWASDKIVLRMTGAQVISENDHPQLYNLVHEIVIASGLPMPKIAIVSDNAPNAFATGRDPEHAVIAFTTGLLEKMDREQIQGVVAHELAHVANRDTLVSAVAATTARALALMSDLLIRMMWFGTGRNRNNNGGNPLVFIAAFLAIILAPIAASLLKSAISRKRESLADATAVSYTRNPAGLRRALETLAADSTVVNQRSTAVAHVWIESPLDARAAARLFATHPPIEERIALLRQMENGRL